MTPRNTCLPVVLAVLMLTSACSSSKSWVPDVSLPDFSKWFSKENEVLVTEVANSSQCNAPDEQTRIALLPSAQAAADWQAARGIQLPGAADLPPGRYVAVDLGLRTTAGYGLAVSRQAGLNDGVLVLKATSFAPAVDAISAQVMTSPCALVRLPAIEFNSMRLIDQSGKLRGSAAGTVGKAS
ncbi:protease complex subunit PrcB family protein [Hydrocarboniphaga sp.]|uniref:protease complex subunit PrcB family protein n=1 Tax=Hydrocarboniphaga sp. TaxID=2033016 RepID=UPI0026050D03|nr:protease complex subunit PrcB family protein [Hydrocarboniphaga sp.]